MQVGDSVDIPPNGLILLYRLSAGASGVQRSMRWVSSDLVNMGVNNTGFKYYTHNVTLNVTFSF